MNSKVWQNISDETVNGPHQQILKYKKVLEEYWYISSMKYRSIRSISFIKYRSTTILIILFKKGIE